jgi:hypothetical protein
MGGSGSFYFNFKPERSNQLNLFYGNAENRSNRPLFEKANRCLILKTRGETGNYYVNKNLPESGF